MAFSDNPQKIQDPQSVMLDILKQTSSVLKEIKEGQKLDLGFIDQSLLFNRGKEVDFRVDENGVMIFRDKVCVPQFPKLKKRTLEEGHRSGLSIHLSATKMYQDLKKMFGGHV